MSCDWRYCHKEGQQKGSHLVLVPQEGQRGHGDFHKAMYGLTAERETGYAAWLWIRLDISGHGAPTAMVSLVLGPQLQPKIRMSSHKATPAA